MTILYSRVLTVEIAGLDSFGRFCRLPLFMNRVSLYICHFSSDRRFSLGGIHLMPFLINVMSITYENAVIKSLSNRSWNVEKRHKVGGQASPGIVC